MYLPAKHIVTLCAMVCVCTSTLGNSIDTLSSKESIQRFLTAYFKNGGITYINHLTGLKQSEQVQFYLSDNDTVLVEDPITREYVFNILPRDTIDLIDCDTGTSTTEIGYSNIENYIEKKFTQYAKVDIDNNGYTDLVIDAGGVLVIMDMGDKLEGHILNDCPDFHSYCYVKSVTLPDGSNAIILRRNPCTIEYSSLLEYNSVFQKYTPAVSYVVDTTYQIGAKTEMPVDTLYKVISFFDTIPAHSSLTGDSVAKEIRAYRDTVYEHRYNKMDTIVYRYGDFAKYNRRFIREEISKVYFYDHVHISPASMEINKDGTCYLKYAAYDTILTGHANEVLLNELWEYISYIGIKEKNSHYTCMIEAGNPIMQNRYMQNSHMHIYYDDGTVKKFTFNNGIPPMELGYVMNKIFTISMTVNWKSTNEETDIKCPWYWQNEASGSSDNYINNCRCGL